MTDEGERRSFSSVLATIFGPVLDVLDDFGGTLTLFLQTLTWAIRPPFRFAQFLSAFDFIGAGSTFIVALVGLFTGMAFTVSTIVGVRQVSAENMVGGVVGIALARELAPVLAAVVITARAGSTMASELGNMRVTEQIDAITTMGVNPVQYLVVPRVLASVVVTPMLALVFGIAGMGGAYVVAVLWQGLDPGLFFDKVQQFIQTSDIRMCLIKATVFGLLVSVICCKKGFHASGGARGVGEATAKAVVASIVVVFCADYILTTILTEI